MKSLEARITALEQRKPAPNVCFVMRLRPDGKVEPLRPGTVYGKHVAVLPTIAKSPEEWLKIYGPESDALERLGAFLKRGATGARPASEQPAKLHGRTH
ncbi:MAG TPA: hypothetical protein VFB08_02200 [Burkholderiales bacterium]|nr:hypothetical protein [Burkholderiales bacterium]